MEIGSARAAQRGNPVDAGDSFARLVVRSPRESAVYSAALVMPILRADASRRPLVRQLGSLSTPPRVPMASLKSTPIRRSG